VSRSLEGEGGGGKVRGKLQIKGTRFRIQNVGKGGGNVFSLRKKRSRSFGGTIYTGFCGEKHADKYGRGGVVRKRVRGRKKRKRGKEFDGNCVRERLV